MTKRRKTDQEGYVKKSSSKKQGDAVAQREDSVSTPGPYKNGSTTLPGSSNNANNNNEDGDGEGYEEEEEDEGEEFGGVTSQDPNVSSEAQEREKLRLLLSNFSEDQMSRYEAFRRANLNRTGIKKLANAVLNQSITGNVAVTLSGLAKVFVGELVEKAREVEKQMDREFLAAQANSAKRKREDGSEETPVNGEDEQTQQQPPPPLLALRPEHMREAWRLYRKEMGTVPAAHWRRQGGEGDGRFFR